ncbi:MAG TPA: hypothetical protein VG098_00380, partial [Nitrososphaera sp.]|nr:hypothetical protein [Nitrososphaera sp.]
MQSLHTAIAVVIVAFATACWGMMASLPAITDTSLAYAQEAEQPVPPSSSPSTNTTAGEVNATNNQTEAIGV